jgi:hypothetical protein
MLRWLTADQLRYEGGTEWKEYDIASPYIQQIAKSSFEMLHDKLVESLPQMEGRFAGSDPIWVSIRFRSHFLERLLSEVS